MFTRLRQKLYRIGFLIFFAWLVYYVYWGSHLYKITAYCNCPICINEPKYRDGRFASGKPLYWGAAAADKSVRFGSRIELVPVLPKNWKAVSTILKGRRRFTIEDRGGEIKGKDIDLYIPQSRGGHKTALKWGVRYMRIKINGRFAK
ncbi:MAG: 3D domain-containing protein [Candidatus Omnitrophica bacterium]|nr:3D domain-containing protein [Candidatus Omnitrophota bacterium]